MSTRSILRAGILLTALIAGCTSSGGSSPDGSTSWLRRCGADSDCGSTFGCRCGVCTRFCGPSASCADLGKAATCASDGELAAVCASPAGGSGICLQACDTSRDCGPGRSCVGGVCDTGSTDGGVTDAARGGASGAGGTRPGSGGASSGDASTGGAAGGDASTTDEGARADASLDGGKATPTDGATSLVTPPSCLGLPATCGVSGNESCCESLRVTGGSFFRSYDGLNAGYTSQAYPATVSDYSLDKFEITVGRFRQFKTAWDAGWRPADGAGKHAHLNAGSGLSNGTASGHEPGWESEWTAKVAPTEANLTFPCGYNGITSYATWTTAPAGNEDRPINCINWWETYAFCIWDDAFLPSEAEWNYAAAGGAQQRPYPWGATVPGDDGVLAAYGCFYDRGDAASCTGIENLAKVGAIPPGNGRYGQSDLAGNLWEWNLDYQRPYRTPCADCASVIGDAPDGGLSVYAVRGLRGGAFTVDTVPPSDALLVSPRGAGVLWAGGAASAARDHRLGGRCARGPEVGGPNPSPDF